VLLKHKCKQCLLCCGSPQRVVRCGFAGCAIDCALIDRQSIAQGLSKTPGRRYGSKQGLLVHIGHPTAAVTAAVATCDRMLQFALLGKPSALVVVLAGGQSDCDCESVSGIRLVADCQLLAFKLPAADSAGLIVWCVTHKALLHMLQVQHQSSFGYQHLHWAVVVSERAIGCISSSDLRAHLVVCMCSIALITVCYAHIERICFHLASSSSCYPFEP
jgi:hypothetical protein